ncbi:MAG: putative LPS assembly protein LptD, partial [Gammaproteobacteria bacterium]
MYIPMRRLSVASLLALSSAFIAADPVDPWQCGIAASGLWECVGTPATPETEAAMPAAVTDAAETRADDEVPATEPAETPAALQSTPATRTPLFPTTAPHGGTLPVVESDSPAETVPATERLGEITSETADAAESATLATEAVALPDTAAPPEESAPAADQPELKDQADAATVTALTAATDAGDSSADEELQYSRWEMCPPVDHRLVETPIAETGAIELQADNARFREGNIFILEGNAVAQMDWKRLEADRITYHQEEGRIDAEGNLLYTSPEVLVDGDRGTFFPDTDSGDVEHADYALPDMHARGSASSVELDGRDWQTLKDVSYTTCPINSTDWEIFAKKVDLDQKDGTGTARHAKVELKGVPVLYTPYLSFPLDDRRKSGLLVPKFGTTEETGVDISVPYYWNIAPNRDATIVPRYMSKRGVMLGGEFRYRSLNHKGEL